MIAGGKHFYGSRAGIAKRHEHELGHMSMNLVSYTIRSRLAEITFVSVLYSVAEPSGSA